MDSIELRNHLIGIQNRMDIMIQLLRRLVEEGPEEDDDEEQEEPEEKNPEKKLRIREKNNG